jgi:D-lactate dehydrogenase
VTGHQGFFTVVAMREIAQVTVSNLRCFVEGASCPNAVRAP